jgi:hypothetical protein
VRRRQQLPEPQQHETSAAATPSAEIGSDNSAALVASFQLQRSTFAFAATTASASIAAASAQWHQQHLQQHRPMQQYLGKSQRISHSVARKFLPENF